jgi:hypothetical protein
MIGLSAGTVAQSTSLIVFVYCCEQYMFTAAIKVKPDKEDRDLGQPNEMAAKPKGTFVISEIGDDLDDVQWD